MGKGRTQDFDQFDEESGPIEIKWRRKTWSSDGPVSAEQGLRVERQVLATIALQAWNDPNEEVDDDTEAYLREQVQIASELNVEEEMRELFGDDQVNEMMEVAPLEMFRKFFNYAFELPGAPKAGDAEGEANAPKGAANREARRKQARARSARRKTTARRSRSSSKSGAASKRTSTRSTA
jgi:hypothetical protein